MTLLLTDEDIEIGSQLLAHHRITPLDRPNMFKGAIYSLLSYAEAFGKYEAIYNLIEKRKHATPKNILANRVRIEGIVRSADFSSEKIKGIMGLARKWGDDSIPDDIIYDLSHDCHFEDDIRELIAKNWYGFGYRNASFFMSRCGYENVMAFNNSMVLYLNDCGCGINVTYDMKNGTPKKGQYIDVESQLRMIASAEHMSPVLFQNVISAKCTGWKPRE